MNTNENLKHTSVLSLSGVTKIIGGKTIVEDLSFDIGEGEIVGLLGPNGAGKTTTIRMIVGLISMTKGDVMVRGKSIRKDLKGAISQIGGIIENPEFYPYMTGYDNLKQYQRMSPWIQEERIHEVTRLVGLENAMDRKVKSYSLGMRQRLGIAQALLHEPSVLILDEPTNGLDPAGIREMRDYMKKIANEEGISVLVSSHLLSEMELLCNRVVVIQNGKLVTVRNIGGEDESGQQLMNVSVRVGKYEEAHQLLSKLNQVSIVRMNPEDRELTLAMKYEDIPDMVTALGAGQIPIYRIAEAKSSLEDEFLEWTGGNRIA